MAEGLNAAGRELGAAGPGIAVGITHIQMHTAEPDETSGGFECTSTRKAVVCTTDGAGNVTIPETAFPDLQPNEPTRYLGLWSAATGGVFYGYKSVTGDQQANSQGEFTFDTSSITSESE